MKVIITGGSGFIGTNLVSFYADRGIDICNIDHTPPRNKEHGRFWKQVDIMNFERLREIIYEFSPMHIFHLVARTETKVIDIVNIVNEITGNHNGVEFVARRD